jgi:hypothetical protein
MSVTLALVYKGNAVSSKSPRVLYNPKECEPHDIGATTLSLSHPYTKFIKIKS